MQPMRVTEADLHRVSSTARWAVERASLSEAQIDKLIAIVKRPIPDEKLARFWLNELFANYVEDVAKRSQPALKDNKSGSRPLIQANSRRARSKLSTRLRGETQAITRPVQRAASLLQGRSPSARDAIRTYIWNRRLVGCTRVRRQRTYRETWQNAHDALMLVQVACERWDEVGIQCSGPIRAELVNISNEIDALIAVFDGVSDLTRNFLRRSFAEFNRLQDWPQALSHGMDDPLRDVWDWLVLLEWIATRPRIEVRRGRDEVPQITLVAGLAELYREFTGEEARRVYRLVETCGSGPFGEGGDLLELARALVSYADEKAPGFVKTRPPSLARIVRQTLEKRRAALRAHR